MNQSKHISRRDFLKIFSQIGASFVLGITGYIRLFGAPRNGGVGVKPTSTWKPTLPPTPTLTRRPVASPKPTLTHIPTKERLIGGGPTPTASITRKPTAAAIATSTPTATVNRASTASLTPTSTYTRRPLATSTSTKTGIPTSDRSTSTPTATLVPTATPDLRGLVLTTPENFEIVLGLIATSVNAVSVAQDNERGIDKSDLVEYFLDFNREKYDEYLKGERPYRYLDIHEYKYSTDPNAPPLLRAVINVPDSIDGSSERKYLDEILQYLNKKMKVDTSKLDNSHLTIITREIMESNRFTCIKFLRFIWCLFGEVYGNGIGMFPQVYQARIINAGQLARQIESGKSLFDPNNLNILQTGLIKNTYAIATHPEDDPDFFDGKVMVFFRPQASASESGHVGLCKVIALRNHDGSVKRMTITFIEVDGNTGQAYYGYRIHMDDFRNHLFMDMERSETVSQRLVGWMFNRTQ